MKPEGVLTKSDPDLKYGWRAYAGYLAWMALGYLGVVALTIASRGNPERLVDLGIATPAEVQARLFSRVAFFVYPVGAALFAFAGAFLITLDRHFDLDGLTSWAPRHRDAVILPRLLYLFLFILALPFCALALLNAFYLDLPVAVLWFDLVLAYLFLSSLSAYFAMGLGNDIASLFAAMAFVVLVSLTPEGARQPSSFAFANPLITMFHPEWVSDGILQVPSGWRPAFAFHWLFLIFGIAILISGLFYGSRSSSRP